MTCIELSPPFWAQIASQILEARLLASLMVFINIFNFQLPIFNCQKAPKKAGSSQMGNWL